MPRKETRERQEAHLVIRVPLALVNRLDALVSKVGELSEFALAGSLDRSKVARVALLRGIASLERAANGAN